ncbi:hypothetical protein EUGRSUZ_F04103 [Eucalyptus grandis]|uniref:Uncharacterized protein n=2 Tax=Eucalyptus grandis TaxID=71139 RepID=A0ACC3KPK3_EUCGR|nr:hypothetical protein EUGRSUZ_F04103 [Eucalyptus grandis]
MIQSLIGLGIFRSPALISTTSRGFYGISRRALLSPSTQMAEPKHSPQLDPSLASCWSRGLTRSDLS